MFLLVCAVNQAIVVFDLRATQSSMCSFVSQIQMNSTPRPASTQLHRAGYILEQSRNI